LVPHTLGGNIYHLIALGLLLLGQTGIDIVLGIGRYLFCRVPGRIGKSSLYGLAEGSSLI
jgi:hypothetical protein